MTPRRRPLQRDDLNVEATLGDFRAMSRVLELGWTQAREQMQELGWPERSPRQRSSPRITIRCRECDKHLVGSAAKDEHQRDTEHTLYAYTPALAPEPSSIDYADTTGEQATSTRNRVSDDLLEMQDLWVNVCKSYRQLLELTKRYVPTAWHGEEPACWYHTECGNTVEPTGGGGFRGMDRVAGLWVARPGITPVCAKHRSQERRVS